MSFTLSPPVLYLGGPVVGSDWDAWEEAMRRFGAEIKIVALHDSGGGDSLAGRRIGNDIRKRNLQTVVHGRCSSAWRICFSAARNGSDHLAVETCHDSVHGSILRHAQDHHERNPDVIDYHGSYSKRTQQVNREKPGDYFLDMTDGKMDAEFVERFIRLENQKGLMRFFRPAQRGKPDDPLALLCLGDEERDKLLDQCERIPDIDALSKGVVTTWGEYELAPRPEVSRKQETRTSRENRAQLLTPRLREGE